ncbi:hypothetical protein [Lactococcus petauri]|uniref:hypothetical protein n=1 Tax=Lactococcus petauri TaxID=1940789 RepID=UPI00385361F0
MRIITNIAKGKLLMLNLLKGKLGESIKIYFKILRIFLMLLIFLGICSPLIYLLGCLILMALSPLLLTLILVIKYLFLPFFLPVSIIYIICFIKEVKSIPEKYIRFSKDEEDNSIKKTQEEYLEELNSRYNFLYENGKTLEDLIKEIANEHSKIYLQFYLSEFKQHVSRKFTDSKNISFIALILSICSIMLGLLSQFKDTNTISQTDISLFIVFCFSIIFIFAMYQAFSKKPKKLAIAIFLLEEAIKIKK